MQKAEAISKLAGVIRRKCANGARLKALQEAMGHKFAETTSVYIHDEALSVKSPLDA